MPGGEAAVRQPWRMACSWLAAAFDEPRRPPPQLARQVDQDAWRKVSELAVSGLASPLTTSAGRLFDAVAALCGLRVAVNYEGQAAVELEAACDPGERDAYPLPLIDDGGPLVMDARPAVRAIVSDLGGDVEPPIVAARFHNALAAATADACAVGAERRGTGTVVLSGVAAARLAAEQGRPDVRA
jgi:hydrogenase maturation protein HypF